VRFLYDAVGFGMWAYSNAAFRIVVVGPRRFRLEPGTIITVTHRRETDVPVISPPLYLGARLWRNVDDRMAFAARDDMFVRGFFAGFPEGLSPRARRLLYRIGVGPMLPLVQVHPIGSARLALVKEVLEERPGGALDEVLPDDLAESFRIRAAELGVAAPSRAHDALRGEYADLLWRTVSPEEAGSDGLEHLWARRAGQAARDFRVLVDLVRAGRSLLVFPEGRPSPNGEIGPLRRGVAALIRRARPRHLLPVALAYDPLVRGRTRVLVSFGQFLPPPTDDIEQAVLAQLRRTMPLTCGQFVAGELLAGRTPSLAGLADAVAAAREDGRPVDPDLLTGEDRARRLAAALPVAERRRDELPFLAREYESARSKQSAKPSL
jgi:1-acyl-sn-glycerol-3-phosphate acyltransferase